jgi:hypothetical protein
MANPSSLRDSTQIVLPWEALDGLRCELESEFTVTVYDEGEAARIIGSPVVIKNVTDFLARNGVSLR